MCLQCGCGRPYDEMGDKDNLVVDHIKKSVATDNAKGLTTDEAIQNIVKTWEKAEAEDRQYKVETNEDEAAA